MSSDIPKENSKRKSPKDTIEGEPNSEVEHAYVKFPGKELIEISLESTKNAVIKDYFKASRLMNELNKKQYTYLHTHINESDDPRPILIPSVSDIYNFLNSPDVKTMIVAQQNDRELQGYYILRKTESTPKFAGKQGIISSYFNKSNSKGVKEGVKTLTDLYSLKSKFIPAKGYKFVSENDSDAQILKKARFEKESTLEKNVAAAIAIGMLSISILISSNITGFSVANLTTKSLNIIGGFLFIVSLAGLFFILKKSKTK